jgi:hypothetical protein
MLIEDVACPVDKLADMTVDLGEMFQRYGYHEASCFGHALEGNLHLVFSQVGLHLFWTDEWGVVSKKSERQTAHSYFACLACLLACCFASLKR